MRSATILILGVILLALPFGPIGCGKRKEKAVAQVEPKKEEPKSEPKKDGPVQPQQEFKKPPIRGGSVVRRVDEADVKNMLRQLHIATAAFQATSNRFPKTREELEDHYGKDAKINAALKDGDLVYVFNLRKTEDPTTTVLAYEGQADTLGRRVVLMANGELPMVNEDEFKKMVKTAKTLSAGRARSKGPVRRR